MIGTIMVAPGCDAVPDGNVIIPDQVCHELLQTQCECCGSNRTSCVARVDYLVVHAQAVTGLTEADCQARLDEVAGDVTAWCVASFDTHDRLDKACQGYPPTAADAAADATSTSDSSTDSSSTTD